MSDVLVCNVRARRLAHLRRRWRRRVQQVKAAQKQTESTTPMTTDTYGVTLTPPPVSSSTWVQTRPSCQAPDVCHKLQI